MKVTDEANLKAEKETRIAASRLEKNENMIDPNVDQEFVRRVCAAHNRFRKYHGAPPVFIDW